MPPIQSFHSPEVNATTITSPLHPLLPLAVAMALPLFPLESTSQCFLQKSRGDPALVSGTGSQDVTSISS